MSASRTAKIGATKRRPGRPATGMDPIITVRLPAELIAVLGVIASEQGMTRSDIIRSTLLRYARRQQRRSPSQARDGDASHTEREGSILTQVRELSE